MNKRKLKDLKIIHWNCNSLGNKIEEFKHFLSVNKPDIVSLNETKINEFNANFLFNSINNYKFVHKHRPSNKNGGGGVALLIHKNLKFNPLNMFDNLNIEVLGIKIKFGKEDIMIISYYNPPDKMLSKELFTVIQDLKINYILLGDLNSKLTSIGCNKDNRNGIFLEEILNNNNCVIVNDKTHTYYPFHENYSCDILDLALCSSFLYKYIKEFVVLRESDMSSDHVPIMIILKTDNSFTSDDTRHQNTFYNYNKADWKKFKANLPSEIPEEIKSNVELLNNFVINQLQASAKISIPLKNPNKKSGLQLPAYILELIKYRKIFRKKFQTEKTTDNRQSIIL
jgi:exonuclease III